MPNLDDLKSENTAVLMIDMQENFLRMLDEKTREELVEEQIFVLNSCALEDIPVLSITNVYGNDEQNEIFYAIRKVPRQIHLKKSLPDAFTEEEFRNNLRRFKPDYVYLMGLFSGMCVKSTAEGAIRNGFNIATSSLVIGDYNLNDNYKEWFQQNGIWTKTPAEIPLFISSANLEKIVKMYNLNEFVLA